MVIIDSALKMCSYRWLILLLCTLSLVNSYNISEQTKCPANKASTSIKSILDNLNEETFFLVTISFDVSGQSEGQFFKDVREQKEYCNKYNIEETDNNTLTIIKTMRQPYLSNKVSLQFNSDTNSYSYVWLNKSGFWNEDPGYYVLKVANELAVYKCTEGHSGSAEESLAYFRPDVHLMEDYSKFGKHLLQLVLEFIQPVNLTLIDFETPRDLKYLCRTKPHQQQQLPSEVAAGKVQTGIVIYVCIVVVALILLLVVWRICKVQDNAVHPFIN